MSRTMIGTVEVAGHFNEICELKTLFRRWVDDDSDNREVVVVVDLRQKVSPGTRYSIVGSVLCMRLTRIPFLAPHMSLLEVIPKD